MLRTLLASLALVATVAAGLPALAADPPYLKLAQALGTPHLADSAGPADHSQLQLKFTPTAKRPTNIRSS